MSIIDPVSISKAFMTGSLAFGIFPKQPKLLTKIFDNVVMRWLFVFILVFQGNGEFNVMKSVITTTIIFVIIQILYFIDGEEDKEDNVLNKGNEGFIKK